MIPSFTGKNVFLSNFYIFPISWKGIVLPSSEHAYQSEKPTEWLEREMIYHATTPAQAKKFGSPKYCKSKRKDWDEVKHDIMLAVLDAKFSAPAMAELLKATGDEELVEGNAAKKRRKFLAKHLCTVCGAKRFTKWYCFNCAFEHRLIGLHLPEKEKKKARHAFKYFKGRCQCCGRKSPLAKSGWCLDHLCKRFRGIICKPCNAMLTKYVNVGILRKGIRYLRRADGRF